jgi:hypothetical protein
VIAQELKPAVALAHGGFNYLQIDFLRKWWPTTLERYFNSFRPSAFQQWN